MKILWTYLLLQIIHWCWKTQFIKEILFEIDKYSVLTDPDNAYQLGIVNERLEMNNNAILHNDNIHGIS